MYTIKDIDYKSIFVINCMEKRELHVKSGELLLEDADSKTLTKIPFQKVLAIFIIGHIHITTPLIDKCSKFNVALIVVNSHFRPVFYWANEAEANFLLRKKQFELEKDDISIAKIIVRNKIENQMAALKKTRKTDSLTKGAISTCGEILKKMDGIHEYNELMGLEGFSSKVYFSAYYQIEGWGGRSPRTKCDIYNTTLDIGYTILFNFIECFIRLFGFDVYVGVYHRLWFKRKSLVCDLMEPFRCIVDRATRTAFSRKQFTEKDFVFSKGEYRLKITKNAKFAKVYFDALIPYKQDVFKYIQNYYRCFMKSAKEEMYPKFVF